jgi:hypothetical protein
MELNEIKNKNMVSLKSSIQDLKVLFKPYTIILFISNTKQNSFKTNIK